MELHRGAADSWTTMGLPNDAVSLSSNGRRWTGLRTVMVPQDGENPSATALHPAVSETYGEKKNRPAPSSQTVKLYFMAAKSGRMELEQSSGPALRGDNAGHVFKPCLMARAEGSAAPGNRR